MEDIYETCCYFEGLDTGSDCLWTKGHDLNTRFGMAGGSCVAVAAMSRKTTVKSDVIKYISTPFSEELNISMLFLSFLYNFFVPPLQFLRFLWFVDLSFALKCTMRKRGERQRAPLTRHCEGAFLPHRGAIPK